MSRKKAGLLLALAATVLMVGCTSSIPPLTYQPRELSSGQYAAKVDNFELILDASMTMGNDEQRNFISAKNFLGGINQSIPSDLNFNGGLRTFGHSDRQSANKTDLVYGMNRYTRAGLQQGLDSVKYAGGNSPLTAALMAAANDLQGATGPTAIVVVSDGLQMKDAPAAAAKLKADLGSNACIYTVHVGDSAGGMKTLQKVAEAGGCGTAESAENLTARENLLAYVEKVFLTKKGACPDRDRDGVCDSRDKCPNTMPGVMVDKDGCALKYTLQIEFDFDKADIRPKYHDQIAAAAAFVKRYPDTHILVAGHTDSVGEESYNKGLSMQRAQALKAYLVQNFGVKAAKLHPRGFGESQPVASNDTEAGRQMNRRVELICCTLIPPE